MGNITIGGSKVLTITSASSKSLVIPVEPSLSIVQTMQLSYELSNNQWLFSLNGVTQDIKDLLDDGYTMQIQLIKYHGFYIRDRQENVGYTSIKFPNYLNASTQAPGSVSQDRKARVSINNYLSNAFNNMNLTQWVNNMIYYSSLRGSYSGFVETHVTINGYWFTKIAFCILINNQKLATSTIVTLNIKNNQQPINTNYSIINNTIDVVAL
jgi:hypothetical protein